jgi:hypothetical protein
MNEEEFFFENFDLDEQFNDISIEFDDYPESDSIEYTTDW